MNTLYQPVSRTFGQRDGCLTPANAQYDNSSRNSQDPRNKQEILDASASALSSASRIISPPISPFRRGSVPSGANNIAAAPTNEQNNASQHAYRLDQFQSHYMTVTPWAKINSGYLTRQLKFLGEYSFDAPKVVRQTVRSTPKRSVERRKRKVSNSSSESEDVGDRVRTRNTARRNSVDSMTFSATESETVDPVTPPKRRKVRKEPSYSGSPLAAQQAALIDESIPDYSPDAFATLPKGNSRALKIDWKGQSMDMRFDPDLDKLHPAEIVLASILRLRGRVYLDSKRRFFFEKVNRLRNGKPFRRTDAQKACRIDVNKASRLFAAFEKAGWLDDKNFKQFL